MELINSVWQLVYSHEKYTDCDQSANFTNEICLFIKKQKGPFIQSANANAKANAVFRPGLDQLFVTKPFKQSANSNTFLFARTTRLDCPLGDFFRSSRGFFLLTKQQILQLLSLHHFHKQKLLLLTVPKQARHQRQC